MRVGFTVNAEPVEIEARPDETLLEVLRRHLAVTSIRLTCGVGVCGSCTALVDGRPMSTCLLLAPLADGRAITTVEGLGGVDRVQLAFLDAHAFQCGYCTPGMILMAKCLLEENPHPTREEIKLAMSGNLCRCGCYAKIVEAIERAAA